MDRVDWIAAIAVAVAISFAGVIAINVCASVQDSIWQRDCNAIGKHVVDGKVYVCYPEAQAHD